MGKRRIRAIVGEIDVRAEGFAALTGGPYTSKDLRTVMKNESILNNVRANVIAHALWIEDFLDDIIETVLFPGKNLMVFKDCMYDDLRFRKKSLIFKSILDNKIIKLDNANETIRRIQEIITVRNDFAHGRIFFNRKKMFLRTVKGREVELDDAYFERVNDNLTKATETLSKILEEI